MNHSTAGRIMETINLETTRDEAFLREVEAESGQKVTNCYQCGNCTAGCPCGPEYDLQVSQVMRAVQLGNKEMALSSRSLWLCVSCSTCTSRCPNNIDVAKVMDVLRHMAWKEGKTNYAMASFWQSFLTTVRHFGRTYELGVSFGDGCLGPGCTLTSALRRTCLALGRLCFREHLHSHRHCLGAARRILQRHRR